MYKIKKQTKNKNKKQNKKKTKQKQTKTKTKKQNKNKNKNKKTFLIKFDIKNGFFDSFPLQKCILKKIYIHHSCNKKVTACNIFHNFWVDTPLNDMFVPEYNTCNKSEGWFSRCFEIKTGVRQGDILSSILFCLAIDFVTRTAVEKNNNKGLTFLPRRIL